MKKTTVQSRNQAFEDRLHRYEDELRWLYMELYDNSDMYYELCQQMTAFSRARKAALKKRDEERCSDPEWFKRSDMLGMMMYVDNFAGTLKGMSEKLDYLKQCNVNYVHLMPLLDTTEGKSDGGYAVSDFRKVQKKLGTMSDLERLTGECHKQGMNVCLDFVMNHTSEDHEWAKRARQGEGEYMSRYFFFDNYDIPAQYEKTVPQVFPTTAPGNFTWLPEIGHYVMTTFYPYQWDLNYRNPRVFNEMMYNFLYLANKGVDIFRIDAVPYIWKELGTTCRNLPKVHTIVRMMRLIGEIVCPGVLLLGEVVMEPEKVVPYFGTLEKPECHMLYNVTTMATTWNSVATRDVRLLKKQMDVLAGLPKDYVFLNYLRCHDDIGWGLEYSILKDWSMDEVPHKKYINDFFTGRFPGSFSRGELYNEDPVTGDARFCGTTASMCGIEKGVEEQDEAMTEEGIRRDLMLHAYMFTQSGIPILYSGDEIGQFNDYDYKKNPQKAEDSRYIHRGAFPWEKAARINEKNSVESRLFHGLWKLEEIRRQERVFHSSAAFYTIDTEDRAVLCMVREYEGERMIGVFNFSEEAKTVRLNQNGTYRNLVTDEKMSGDQIELPGCGFYWLKQG